MLIQLSRFAWLINAQCEFGFPVGHVLAAKSERDSRVGHCSIPAQFHPTKKSFAPWARLVACTSRVNRLVCDTKMTHRAKTQVFGCSAMDAI